MNAELIGEILYIAAILHYLLRQAMMALGRLWLIHDQVYLFLG